MRTGARFYNWTVEEDDARAFKSIRDFGWRCLWVGEKSDAFIFHCLTNCGFLEDGFCCWLCFFFKMFASDVRILLCITYTLGMLGENFRKQYDEIVFLFFFFFFFLQKVDFDIHSVQIVYIQSKLLHSMQIVSIGQFAYNVRIYFLRKIGIKSSIYVCWLCPDDGNG